MNQKIFQFLASPKCHRFLPFFLLFLLASTFGICFLKFQNYQNFIESSENLAQKTLKSLDKKKSFDAFIQNHTSEGSSYFEDKLQTFTPLQTQIDILEKHMDHPLGLQKEIHQKRLNFLKSDQNRFELTSADHLENGKMLQEHLRMKHPIEVDKEDLKLILNFLEGDPQSQLIEYPLPQIIITSFHLKKEPFGFLQEKQIIDLQLCKRHFSP